MSFLKKIFRTKLAPPPIFRQNHDYFVGLNQDQPLIDYDFVVFDTELTGLDQRRDEIIAIGAVRIHKLQILAAQSFHSYVQPIQSAVNQQTFIHRITPQQLAHAPAIKEVLPRFLEFCGPCLLVGHCVDIDMSFVNRAAVTFFHGRFSNPCLDTMRLAQIYTHKSQGQSFDQGVYNLQHLAKRYELPRFPAHDALGDALQTAYLFLFLVKKLQQFKLVTLKDFFNAGQFWRNML